MADINTRLQRYDQRGFFEKHWHLAAGTPEASFLERDTHGFTYAVSCSEKDITTGKSKTAALKIIPIDEASLRLPKDMPRSARQAALNRELRRVEDEINAMSPLKGVTNIAYFRSCAKVERTDSSLRSWDILILMDQLISLKSYRERNPHASKSGAQVVQALQIWKDISSALCVCENVPVIHANIKPTNVLYQPVHDLFKLANFGVSIPASTFKEGIRHGTLEYMSPEMYDWKGGDVRTDIYSLGVMIYELLNDDRLPLQEGNERGIAYRRRLEEKAAIPPIDGIPDDINEALLTCLEVDPSRRFASWKEMEAVALDLYVRYKKYAGSEEPLVEPSAKSRLRTGPNPVSEWVQKASDSLKGAQGARGKGASGQKPQRDWLKLAIIGTVAAVCVVAATLVVGMIVLSGSGDSGAAQPGIEAAVPVENGEEAAAPAEVGTDAPAALALELTLEDAQIVAGTQNAAIRGRVSASGELGDRELEISVDGQVVPAQWEEASEGRSFVASPPTELGAGERIVRARVAGDDSIPAASAALAVVTPEPTATALPPQAFAAIELRDADALRGSALGSVAAGELTGSAQPGQMVQLWVNESEIASATAGEDGSFSLPLTLSEEGENRVAVRYALEQQGAPAGVELDVTLDTQPPVLEAPAEIDQYATELRVQVSDRDDGCRVALLLDGRSEREATARGGVATLTDLAGVDFASAGSIEIEAVDSAGNSARASVAFRPQPTPEPRYVFRSSAVEAAVRAQLGEDWGTIRASDLLEVAELDIGGDAPVNLADLEGMENLTRLRASGCQISGLSAIEGLGSLEELELTRADIDDLSPLSGLVGLRKLDLRGNRIRDLSPLSGLSALSSLILDDNEIEDLSPLSALTGLEELSAADNRIADVGALSGMTRLRTLTLSGNDISDVGALSGLRDLQRLYLSNNRIGDASPLADMAGLELLWLDGNDLGALPDLLARDVRADVTATPRPTPTPSPTPEPTPTPTPRPTPTPEPTPSPTPERVYATLQRGSEGEEVARLQRELIERNYLCDYADGSFGAKTEAAVQLVQQEAGLPVTGVADSATQAAMEGMERPFEPQADNQLMMYAAQYDADAGIVLVSFKNFGRSAVTDLEFTEYQCNASKKHIGDFGGRRNNSGYSYFSTYRRTDVRIEPGEEFHYIIWNFYDGYQGSYSDGESYTMEFFDDGAYARFVLTEYTSEDGKTHSATRKEIYAAIR